MKAILVDAPGAPLRYGEAPDPVPRGGEVVVRVRATAVNRADLLQAAGKYPPPPGESEILGLEAAGEVEETGERVMALLPGGGYAERVAVPREMLVPIPAAMTFEEAAAIPEAWLTAFLNLTVEGGLGAGELVLLHAAASGVGTAAIQLVKAAGARCVATTRSAEKAPALSGLGADLVVDTSREDLVARVEEVFGAQKVDLVLDPLGGPVFAANLRLLSRGGRLVVIATMGGGAAELDLRQLLARRLHLWGSTLRSRAVAEKVRLSARFRHEVLPGFADGRLRPVIDTVLPLSRAAAAHERLARNLNAGKIVLTVGQ